MKIITFGCRLNIFESEIIKRKGEGLSDNLIVVNTCAVTSEAERQCRQAIRKIHKENPTATLVITGCGAQLNPDSYAKIPGVSYVLGNLEKINLPFFDSSKNIQTSSLKDRSIPIQFLTDFKDKTRALIQIQQGCNHSCTFCATHLVRGKNIGLPPEKVIEQANRLCENGFQEITLTGIDIVSYPFGFSDLIDRLLKEVPLLKRLRLGSLDLAGLDNQFISLLPHPILMPHFHFSLQSGDNYILHKMGRRHKVEDVHIILDKLRQKQPSLSFGADIITGFPTETEEQFENTVQLIQKANITHLHIFPYSIRPGTPAANLPMIDVHTRKIRASKLRKIGDILLFSYLDKFINTQQTILTETKNFGYTENYDKVFLTKDVLPNQLLSVKIIQRRGNELVGEP